MKKTILLILIVINIISVSCTKTGEIVYHSRDIITINGKVYQAIKVVPQDDASSIWVVYPKDSTNSSSVITVTRPQNDDDSEKVSAIIQSK